MEQGTVPDTGRSAAAHEASRAGDRGSRTAEIVAVSRARHLIRHSPPHVFEDPYAIHFVGGRWRRILESRLLDGLLAKTLFKKLLPVTTQHLTRARFAEDALAEAIGRGARQYVILGAGFDTFAFRHTALPVTVYEVDLPATMALKRERLAAAGMETPPNLRFVSFDFERDDLAAELAAAGLDSSAPTFFGWMGVTYYLTADAIRDTLRRVAEVARAGGEIAFDYLVADECVPPEDRDLFVRMMDFVGRRGEPMISRFDPAGLTAALDPGEGWAVVRHESPGDQRRRYLEGRDDLPPLAPIAWCVHLRRR